MRGARSSSPSCVGQLGERDQALRRAARGERRVAGGLLEQAARLAPQPALGEHACPTASASAPSRGSAAQRRLEPRQPVGADAGARAGQRRGDDARAPRRRARRCGPRTAAARRARLRRRRARSPCASRRARRRTRRAGRRRRTPSQSAAQLVEVVRACRAPRRPASAAGRARPPREKPWCLASRRAVFSASCGWRAEPRGLQLQAQRMGAPRDAGRQLGEQLERARRVAVVERPFGGEQPRALVGRARRGGCAPATARAPARSSSSRRARSCRRCSAAGGEQVAEHGELVVLRPARASRPGSPARAAPPSGRGCSGRRSTAPALRAAPPAPLRSRRATRHSRARRGRPTQRASAPGSRRRAGSSCRPAPGGTGSATRRAASRPSRSSPGRRCVPSVGGGHHRHGEQQDEPDRRARIAGSAAAPCRPAPGRARSAAANAAQRGSSGRGGERRQRVVGPRAPTCAPAARPGAAARAAICVRLRCGRSSARSRACAHCRSACAVSNWRASSARRALSRRSFRFSRRKNACSGATSIASGWSMRRDAHQRADLRPDAVGDERGQPGRARATRRSPRPSAPTRRGRRGSAPARRGVGASRARGSGAESSGSSSTMRTASSSLIDSVAMSATLDRLARGRGRARWRGARAPAAAGCSAPGARRLCFSAATSGSALPVIAPAAAPTRSAASMSASRFSSRERATDCTSSSSWPRCSATSADARLEQRDLGGGLARRVLRLAGEQLRLGGAARRCPAGACTSSLLAAAHALLARQASASATTATIASSSDDRDRSSARAAAPRGERRRRARRRRCGRSVSGRGSSFTVASIVCRRPPHRGRAAPRTRAEAEPARARARCADGWRAPARATSRSPAP